MTKFSSSLKDKMILILTDSGAIPSFYIRLIDPLSRITDNYNIMSSSDLKSFTLSKEINVVIVHRWFHAQIQEITEQARHLGIPVVYETDDNLLLLSENSRNQLSLEHSRNIERVVRIADLVICSTQTLADFMREKNDRAIVIENYGLLKPTTNVIVPPHLAVVNTDYFKLGSTKSGFFRALDLALRRLDYKITFFGSSDQAMYDLQEEHGDRVRVVGDFVNDRAAFLDRLVESGINVAAVPLEENFLHSFKSDIKFCDFASIGVAGIYNFGDVYHEIKHKENGFLCADTMHGWFEGLKFFQSTANRSKCGLAARSVIEKSRSIDICVQTWRVVLENLFSSDKPLVSVPKDPFEEALRPSPGFGWDDARLIFFDGHCRRHVSSSSAIPILLDSGFGFYDPDSELIRTAPFGLPIEKEADLRRFAILGMDNIPEALLGPGQRLRIGWIVPRLVISSGGHRNIFRCAYQLERLGHNVSLYFVDSGDDDETLRMLVREHFYPIEGHIGVFESVLAAKCDVLMATHWPTVRVAESIRSAVGEIIYFVQDFEPSFYAMGSEYVLAETTYRKGLYAITSGIWCEKILRANFGMEADHFQFPIDRSVYFPPKQSSRANRLIFFAKPDISRRCFELGAEALEIFHRLRPNVEIAFFGEDSASHRMVNFPVTQLGQLPAITDLAELYRTSRAGIAFSTTNPSLVPFEMMACGLPIFDLGRPGNEQNYGNRFDIARLVDPDPAAMAFEIAEMVGNEAELQVRSREGLKFVSTFPTEEEVGRRVESLILQRVSKWKQKIAAPAGTDAAATR